MRNIKTIRIKFFFQQLLILSNSDAMINIENTLSMWYMDEINSEF